MRVKMCICTVGSKYMQNLTLIPLHAAISTLVLFRASVVAETRIEKIVLRRVFFLFDAYKMDYSKKMGC